MIEGTCLCGEISYQVDGELLFLYNCHCVECRAFSGAAHATNASIASSDFQVNDPMGYLTKYSTRGGVRYFCRNCGSSMYSLSKGGEDFPALHVGTIRNPPQKALDANLWTSEKCPWVELAASVASYDAAPT